MSYTNRKLLVSVLWLSWLLFAFSIDHNLFFKFRNFKKSESLDQDNNEELGGSLFEAVSPNSAGKSNIFDNPSKPVIKATNKQPSLDSAMKKINKPSTDRKPQTKVDNKKESKDSNKKTKVDNKKTDDKSKNTNKQENKQDNNKKVEKTNNKPNSENKNQVEKKENKKSEIKKEETKNGKTDKNTKSNTDKSEKTKKSESKKDEKKDNSTNKKPSLDTATKKTNKPSTDNKSQVKVVNKNEGKDSNKNSKVDNKKNDDKSKNINKQENKQDNNKKVEKTNNKPNSENKNQVEKKENKKSEIKKEETKNGKTDKNTKSNTDKSEKTKKSESKKDEKKDNSTNKKPSLDSATKKTNKPSTDNKSQVKVVNKNEGKDSNKNSKVDNKKNDDKSKNTKEQIKKQDVKNNGENKNNKLNNIKNSENKDQKEGNNKNKKNEIKKDKNKDKNIETKKMENKNEKTEKQKNSDIRKDSKKNELKNNESKKDVSKKEKKNDTGKDKKSETNKKENKQNELDKKILENKTKNPVDKSKDKKNSDKNNSELQKLASVQQKETKQVKKENKNQDKPKIEEKQKTKDDSTTVKVKYSAGAVGKRTSESKDLPKKEDAKITENSQKKNTGKPSFRVTDPKPSGKIQNIHAPYVIPETSKMRYYSILILILFGTFYLLLRIFLTIFKNKNFFFMRGIKILAKQIFLYFICLSILIIIYTFGLFDSIPINWEYLIASLAIFGLAWVIFCLLILTICSLAILKWKELEVNSKNSFKSIKTRYESLADKSDQQKFDASEIFELYEYLILKVYFCVPFFPIFKASTLRKDFKFYIYLSFCMLQKIRLFFKLSWTCWVITIIAILTWNVFVASSSIGFITFFLLLFPIIGLGCGLLLYFYMRKVYRRVVQEVNKNNYLSYTDVEFNQNFAFENFKEYPVYLDEVFSKGLMAKLVDGNSHRNFHKRIPNLYEEQVIFGASGFSLLVNIIQCLGFIFIAWSVLIFVKHMNEILSFYGSLMLALIILTLVVYVILYTYLISISIRWLTIISSIEMKRNDRAIKKTINYQLKLSGEMSNGIFIIFKRLYFDIKMNQKDQSTFNSLGKVVCQNLVQVNYMRFIGINEDLPSNKLSEKYPLNVDTELRGFLKSCGMSADDKEIEFMLHLVENYSDKENQLTLEQLYDIWGAHIHFSSQAPEEILNYVFDEYFRRRDDIEPVLRGDYEGLSLEKIEHFCEFYNEYFTLEQLNYIKEETYYLGKSFSRDAFIQMILASRRYFPN